jgi:ComF family protein
MAIITKLHPRHSIHTLRYLHEYAVQLVFPATCITCDATVGKMGSICPECFCQLTLLHNPECGMCGEPFAYAQNIGEEEILCDSCMTDPPYYDKAYAVWKYDALSSRMVKRFKFNDKTQFAPYLATLLFHRAQPLLNKCDIIAPVPLHVKRLRERRYNQSALLAKHVHRHAPQLALMQNLLIRTHYTTPQTTLPFHARQRNVQDAFCVHPRHVNIVTDKHILLIDDVLTTGATVNACARTLKEAGAASVCVATLTKRLKNEEWLEL